MAHRRTRPHARAAAVATGCLLLGGCGSPARTTLERCGSAPADAYLGTTARVGRPLTTFVVNNGDEPEYLDPGLAADSGSSTLVAQLFEGLTVRHPQDLHPTQGVALRYDKSDDNTVYRFHLRPEARWSDGKPVVASDFVYAWRRVLTPATGARMVSLMYALKNGEAFHRGRLLVLRRRVELGDAAKGERVEVPASTVVRVLAKTPAHTRVVPWSEGPAAGSCWRASASGVQPCDPASTGARGLGPVGDQAQGRFVDVQAATVHISCNGRPDWLFRVRIGAQKGVLPGCALRADPAAQQAVVQVSTDVPRYGAPSAPVAGPDNPRDATAGGPRGIVPLSDLRPDPSVVGVRAVGDQVLEVQLERPTPYFLDLCAAPTFAPVRRDVIEHFERLGMADKWTRPDNIVNDGPYTLDQWKFRYEIRFKRNPYHYDHDRLKVHHIVWLEVQDYYATLSLYRTGGLDYIGENVSLPSAYMDQLGRYGDFSRAPYLSTYWYVFNVTKPPVDDERVRRALNLAVDKKLLVERVTRAGQLPATHYVPDDTGAGYAAAARADRHAGRHLMSGPGLDYDPVRARALLTRAGYPVVRQGDGWLAQGFPSLEILYNTSEGHRAIAVALQAMFKQHLGVTVQLRNEEWKVMIKGIRDGHFQIARYGWVADYNHPHTWLETFLSRSPNNNTRWSDPRYDALVGRAAATSDAASSIALYRQAERRALDAMPRLPLYFYTKSTLIKPYVKGYFDNATNSHDMRWMWIDPSWCEHRDGGTNHPAYEPRELPPPGRIAARHEVAP